MRISYREEIELTCEACGVTYLAELWVIIDAQERPDLWEYCREGTINAAPCPNGHPTYLGAPLLLHHGPRQAVLYVPFLDEQLGFPTMRYPTQEELPRLGKELQPQLNFLMSRLLAALPPGARGSYLNKVQLVSRERLPQALEAYPAHPADDQPDALGWDETAAIIQQVDGPYGPNDMPQRIRLIESLLGKVKREKDPATWAWLYSRLGTSYGKNAQGDPDENVERAIEAFHTALMVFERNQFPVDWANQQVNLSAMYLRRKTGDRASNLRAAIDSADAALSWFSKEQNPDLWEMASQNRDAAQSQLALEEQSPGLAAFIQERYGQTRRSAPARPEAAPPEKVREILRRLAELQQPEHAQQRIQMMEEAIGLVDVTDDPRLWAMLQIGLGNELLAGQAGEHTFQQAVAAYQAAIDALSPDDFPKEWAAAYQNLSAAYFNRPREADEYSVQYAIYLLMKALQQLDQKMDEESWAMLANSLGIYILDLRTGDPDENLRRGVDALKAAQDVYTRRTYPRQWASIQYELGRSYQEVESSNRAENYELAIQALEEALRVYTQEHFPLEWARTQQRLGYLYSNRLRYAPGNYDRAIQAYRLAQSVFTRQAHPTLWADIQLALYFPYRFRERGDPDDNNERGLEAIQEALSIYTRERYPEKWAHTQMKLGVAYFDRGYGAPQENLRQALAAFREAQQVYTRITHPLVWAQAEGELATIYSRLAGYSERASYEQQAIDAFQNAIQAYQQAGDLDLDDRINLGSFQTNLAQFYLHRETGDRAQNVESAIGALNAAIQVVPQALYPGRVANFKMLLGEAYAQRLVGDRDENLQQAAAYYRVAVEAHPPQLGTDEALFAARGYARIQARRAAWNEVFAILEPTLEGVETMYTRASTPEARTKTVAYYAELYPQMVKACLRMDPPRKRQALLYAEEGRSRQLRDQLGMLDIPQPAGVPEAVLAVERNLLRELAQLTNPASLTLSGPRQPQPVEAVIARREQLEQVWETMRRKHFADEYVALRRGERIDWDDVRDWLDKQALAVGLLEFFSLEDELVAFILRRGDAEPAAIELDIPRRNLEELAQRFSEAVGSSSARQAGARAEADEQPEALAQAWRELGAAILDPLLPYLAGVDILVVVPHGALHRLPLHALETQGRPLIDRLPVAYAPSIAVGMRVGQLAADDPETASVSLVVGNPTSDLPYAEQEAVEIARLFGVKPLLGAEASKEHIRKILAHTSQAHLATHALFAREDPFASGIVLADGTLTAREIVEQTIPTRLMVLSACETGVQDVRAGDDLVGLARALLYTGVSTMLLSLWRVNDPATKDLMLRFYTHLYSQAGVKQMSTAQALQRAMCETRQARPELYFWAPFVLFGDWR